METGYSKPLQCLAISDATYINEVLKNFHCIIKVKAEIDQFIEGLNTLDIVNVISGVAGF